MRYKFVAIAPPAMMVLPSIVTALPGYVPEKANADESVPLQPDTARAYMIRRGTQ